MKITVHGDASKPEYAGARRPRTTHSASHWYLNNELVQETGQLTFLKCSEDLFLESRMSGQRQIESALGVTGVNSPQSKKLAFSGCNSRPGTGSLHPVAIEPAAEATKLSKPSVWRVARRVGERAGHTVSER